MSQNFARQQPNYGYLNTLNTPLGFGLSSVSDTVTLTSTVSLFFFIGFASSTYTTANIVYRLTTAAITVTWAEVGVFIGQIGKLGPSSLTRVGFTDVSGVWTSTGIKNTSVSLSGVSNGGALWVAMGHQASTAAVARACTSDSGAHFSSIIGTTQTFTGRISTNSPIVASGTTIRPWLTVTFA